MRTLAVVFVAVGVMVVAALVPGDAAADQWQIHLTAAGRAAAQAAIVKRGDLNPKSKFKGGLINPQLHEVWCPNFHPKQSDLVVIGAAASHFSWSDGTAIGSRAVVLETPEMVSLDWQRSMTPQRIACARSEAIDALRGTSGRLVSFGQLAFPQLATYTSVFRALADVTSSGKTVRVLMDQLMLGHGRTEITLSITAAFAARADVDAVERTFAHRLVARAAGAGLEAAALPADALPHASVDHIHGPMSDIAAASTSAVAAYTRMITFPSAKNPPYEFVVEELLGTPTPTAAAATFTKIEHDSHTRTGLASFESVIGDMYMVTVLLGVSPTPAGRLTPHLGDQATEIRFNAHSECCAFEAAVVIIRVRTTVALLYVGAVNTLDRARLARLGAVAASQLARVS